jgi:hypothetical protein
MNRNRDLFTNLVILDSRVSKAAYSLLLFSGLVAISLFEGEFKNALASGVNPPAPYHVTVLSEPIGDLWQRHSNIFFLHDENPHSTRL